jgi:hypothetical protein
MANHQQVMQHISDLQLHKRTVEDFTCHFEPIFDEDGSDWHDHLPIDAELHHWWSIVELEIGQVILAGWHPSAIGYIQTQIAWTEPHDQWCYEYRTFNSEETCPVA